MKTLLVYILIFVSVNLFGQGAYGIPNQYNDYIPPSDLGLLERALRQKQTAYNQNITIIQNKVVQTSRILNQVLNKAKNNKLTLTKAQIDYAQSYVDTINNLHSIDLSLNSNFQNVFNWLDNNETEFLSWL